MTKSKWDGQMFIPFFVLWRPYFNRDVHPDRVSYPNYAVKHYILAAYNSYFDNSIFIYPFLGH